MPARQKFLPANHKGFPFKITVFTLGFCGFFIFSTTPVLNQLSLPAWYARFFQYYFGQDFISLSFLVFLGILLIEFVAGRRLWCRYICPQSILIILTKSLNRNRLKVDFIKENCICKPGYDRCESACSLSLQPKFLKNQLELECSNCGDCIVACNRMGKALFFTSPRIARLPSLPQINHFLPRPKTLFITLLLLIAISFAGMSIFIIVSNHQTDTVDTKKSSPLLANKLLSWKGARAEYYELLQDGTLICVGGEWPTNGYKGGNWEAIGTDGSLKIVFDSVVPTSYIQIMVKDKIDRNGEFYLSRFKKNNTSEAKTQLLTFNRYESLSRSHESAATHLNATAILNRYADEVFVLDLRVQDPKGVIKKILSEGDAITNEVMLTNVKYWMNTPEIIVSEGTLPSLPLNSSIRILFHDGHEESALFATRHIVDRSDEELDDPWF